ncbi:MAG: hypothetical protein ACM359_10685 [Bacillota bacterium]
MTTFFMDLENGNDANDGLTFATRWKTFLNGATAARVAPGDTIRVMASPPPFSIGTATWAQDSAVVTLSQALTYDLSTCETAWTASTNATCVADSTYVKQGSYSCKFTISSTFTTGKVAYVALPSTQNLSSFRFVTFWVRSDTALANGQVSLRLCSDTLGNTTVNTIPITVKSTQNGNQGIPGAGHWHAVTVDFGAGLGSSIGSIALYCDMDLSTTAAVTIWLDNIMVSTMGGTNVLTLNSLIGMPNSTGVSGGNGSESWYPIKCISGTSVVLDQKVDCAASTVLKYGGSTQTVTLWIRNPVIPNVASTTSVYLCSIQESGAQGSPATYSFGWNRTDMSTRTDETWVDGVNGLPDGLRLGYSWTNVDHFGCVRCNYGIYLGSSDCQATQIHAHSSSLYGVYVSAAACYADIVGAHGNANYGVYSGSLNNKVYLDAAYGNGGVGVYMSGGDLRGPTTIANSGTSSAGLFLGFGTRAWDITTRGNAYGVQYQGGPTACPTMIRCTLNEASEFYASSQGYDYMVRSRDHDNTLGYHLIVTDGGKIETDSTTTHSGTGRSWKLSPTSTYRRSGYPLRLRIATIAVKANQAVTVSAWFYRNDTASLSAELWALAEAVKFSGGSTGVGSICSGAVNTWEQKTITFTPTEDGSVDIYAYAYGGTTYSAWVDDLSVSGGVPTVSELLSLDYDAFGTPLAPTAIADSGNIIVIDD